LIVPDDLRCDLYHGARSEVVDPFTYGHSLPLWTQGQQL
jgi:hypothetical protein